MAKILIALILAFITSILSCILATQSLIYQVLTKTPNILSIISIIISLVIAYITIKISLSQGYLADTTGKLTKAIEDLEFDSKIAMMAAYLGNDYIVERINEDVQAAFNLRDYAPPDKQEKLVKYIIKILERVRYAELNEVRNNIVHDIIDLGKKFKIEKDLQQKLETKRQGLRPRTSA